MLSLSIFSACTGGNTTSTTPTAEPINQHALETEEPKDPEPVDVTAVNVNVGALRGPTAMGLVKFMDEVDNNKIDSNDYSFEIFAAIDEIVPNIIQGNLDIAAVPANLSSVLHNNTQGDIVVLAIHTLGMLYIVESGDTIESVEDLRGKTIYANGKGATPEYALNYILAGNGIDPENDVTIEWKSEHAESVALLAANENAIALLPQPFVTIAQTNNENIRVALDLTKEWEELQTSSEDPSALLTGVMVARRSFVEENPAAVSDFMDHYAASVEFVNSNIEQAAILVGQYDIVPTPVAQKAIPYCNIVFIEGQDMQDKLSGYLRVLFDQNPQSVGGEMPNDEFYFKR